MAEPGSSDQNDPSVWSLVLDGLDGNMLVRRSGNGALNVQLHRVAGYVRDK
jgi:hypothetical protein